jgi:LCP family protein required for cell wall assembly
MSDDRGWYPDNGTGGGDRDDDRFSDPSGRPGPGYPPRQPRPARPSRPGGGPYQDRADGPGAGRPPYDPYQDRRDPSGRPYRGYGQSGPRQPEGAWTPSESADRDPYEADPYEAGPQDRRRPDESGPRGRRGVAPTPAPTPAEPDDPWSPRSRSGSRRTAAASAVVGTVNEDLDLDELDPSGRAARSGARGRPLSRKAARRKKIIKWTAISTATTLVLILAVGAYVVEHLTGNIKTAALLPKGVATIAEKADPFGRTPMNILLIGSDTRATAADCELGHDCGPGANGDVEMILHLSADRSNATVISIPRDTYIHLPACAGGGYAGINQSLQFGPDCQVAADQEISGMPIDHFIMIDFGGVVTMSNAIGGVPVCVSENVYDKNSGLRLTKGTHQVEGVQALQFLRTRDAFFDGSDNIGRTQATHIFLSSMIRQIRSKMNLSSIGTLYNVLNAATKSLTVDPGLSGISNLTNLVTDLNKIPTSRITFLTMPNYDRPNDDQHVLENVSEAQPLFDAIKNDQPYSLAGTPSTSTSKSGATAGASPSPTVTQLPVDDAIVRAQVLNGTTVGGHATTVATGLISQGFSDAVQNGDAPATAKTVIYYPSGRAQSAAAVATALDIPSAQVQQSATYSEVTVIIGADWTSGASFPAPAGTGTATPTVAVSAPGNAYEINASSTLQCIPVIPAHQF